MGVQNYSDNGDVQTVIDQMKQDFLNWNIDADPKAIAMMAATIQKEVVSKAGLKGISYGTYNIDSNESINWAVGYGTFQVTPDNKGLVYAFSAMLGGGWKKTINPAGATALYPNGWCASLGEFIKMLLEQCREAVISYYKSHFGADPGPYVDFGYVQDYSSPGNIEPVINQMKQSFSNWALDIDPIVTNMMALTIQKEMIVRAGKLGTSYGGYHTDSIPGINWAMTYGLWVTDMSKPGNMALIYAFCAAPASKII